MKKHNPTIINKDELSTLYLKKKLSMQQIADIFDCSLNKIVYWMNQYAIPRRSLSDAVYERNNPDGDPFYIKPILDIEDARLWGLGVGLYWGEGNKANKHSVRLGNTDPALILTFTRFLVELCSIDKERLKFGLQLFSDADQTTALAFWCQELAVNPSQFYKVTVTISGSIGTYRKKSEFGVVTVYYHNKKLRDILVGMLPR